MKNALKLCLVILLFSLQLQAQDKTETIKTDFKFGGYQFQRLAGGDFVFVYSPEAKKEEIRIYDKELNLRSTYKLPRNPENSEFFVTFPGLDYIYLLSYSWSPESKLTQIKPGSEPITFEMEGLKKLKGIKHVFAGPKYIYYLTQEEKGAKLFAIEHETRKGKLIVPQLSPQTFDRYCSGWCYAGHDSKNIYMYSKTYDFKTNVYTYKIALLDTEGQVEKEFELTGSSKDCVYPSRNYNTYPNAENGERDDIVVESVSTVSNKSYFTIHTYSGITIDTSNKAIYIAGGQGKCVGYSQDAPAGLSLKFGFEHWVMPRLTGSANGLFVHKFDMNGKKLWDVNVEYPADFTSKMSNALPYYRILVTRMQAGSGLLEVAHSTSTSFNGKGVMLARSYITADGQLQNKEIIEYTGGLTGESDSYFDYNENMAKACSRLGVDPKETKVSGYNTGSGNVLYYYNKKEKAVKLLYFKG